jgi:NCS1 family nucleobase:cation symporter-1
MKGTVIPTIVRALPALVWYGVQSWLGGSALNEVSKALFNFDCMILYFALFQFVQMTLSLTGFKGVKWVENIGAVFIICALIYMFYVCLSSYGDVIREKLSDVEGTWGLPFWSTIISFFGVNILVLLNCGDYARELKPGYSAGKRAISYFVAMVPTTVFMGIIGLMISTATGIANPIVAFSTALDNKFLVVVTLCFIIFAQMTTNLLSNVIPPVYALMDIFKMKHKPAAILVSVLAVCACPWLLVSDASAKGLDVFVQIYTALAGPAVSILIVDYFFVRRQRIEIKDLYLDAGPFKGFNPAALLAILVGAAVGLLNIKLSFFTAFIPTALAYYYGTKYMKGAANFRKDSVFDNNYSEVKDFPIEKLM